MNLKQLTPDEALSKAQKYCAYQERCSFEVRRKLYGCGLANEQIDEVISNLEKDNFLSEARFAELFVRSKVNQKKWGKLKIEAELVARNIEFAIIQEQIANINVDNYNENINSLIGSKTKELERFEPIIKIQKLNIYLQSKGYEPDIIIRTIKQIFK
jgi:regulatory protein